jgi:hypothetical protein
MMTATRITCREVRLAGIEGVLVLLRESPLEKLTAGGFIVQSFVEGDRPTWKSHNRRVGGAAWKRVVVKGRCNRGLLRR